MDEKIRAELGIAVWDAVRHMMGVTLCPDDCEALGDQLVQSLRGAGLTVTRITPPYEDPVVPEDVATAKEWKRCLDEVFERSVEHAAGRPWKDYVDVTALKEAGLDIICTRSSGEGYRRGDHAAALVQLLHDRIEARKGDDK